MQRSIVHCNYCKTSSFFCLVMATYGQNVASFKHPSSTASGRGFIECAGQLPERRSHGETSQPLLHASSRTSTEPKTVQRALDRAIMSDGEGDLYSSVPPDSWSLHAVAPTWCREPGTVGVFSMLAAIALLKRICAYKDQRLGDVNRLPSLSGLGWACRSMRACTADHRLLIGRRVARGEGISANVLLVYLVAPWARAAGHAALQCPKCYAVATQHF